MFQLRNAMLGGRSRNINGVTYTSDEIRAQRKSQLTAMGIQNMSEMFDSEIRCCKCHYVDSDFFLANGSDQLRFDALPKGRQSVQIPLDPSTHSPGVRVLKRAMSGLDALIADAKTPTSPIKLARRSLENSAGLEHDLETLRCQVDELKNSYNTIVHEKQVLERDKAYLLQQLETSSLQSAILGHQLTQKLFAEVETRQGKANGTLPFGFPQALEHVSFLRLQLDRLFSTNVTGMTGLGSVNVVEYTYLFDLMMAMTNNVTPKGYERDLLDFNSSRRAEPEDRSLSLDKFFFTLYVLRTGPNSIAIAGVSFGWDRSFVLRWFPPWVRFLKLFCVMFFPRLNEDIILKTTPPNVAKKFKNYGGSFDATEMRLQVASEPMCQRATWSQYKHGNTVKFLVLTSPAGAVVYVSPGFPGRISDPQLIDACMHLDM